MAKKNSFTQFAVLGLGRFGTSIVETLSDADVNVLACDIEEHRLHQVADCATHVVQVDVTNEDDLLKLGLENFQVVIIAIGEDFEASLMAAMIAKESGVQHIVVKARNKRQKTILESMGVNEVILPEHEMGAKLARRLVGSNIMDIFEESDFYTIQEMHPPDEWVNKTVQQADIRRKSHLTILAIVRGEKLIIPVLPDTLITKEDILIALSENKGA